MQTNDFLARHIGPREEDIDEMLSTIGVDSLDELIHQTIPSDIRLPQPLNLGKAMTEYEYTQYINGIAARKRMRFIMPER